MRDAALFFHFLGLIMAMGSGFSSLFLGVYNRKLSPEELPKFMLKLRSLGYMGFAGLILLILSGGALGTPYWAIIGSMPYFQIKLSLVAVLLTLVIMIDIRWRAAIKKGGGPDLLMIAKLGRFAFPVGILVLLFAVLQFH
jgi:hypothetical protein